MKVFFYFLKRREKKCYPNIITLPKSKRPELIISTSFKNIFKSLHPLERRKKKSAMASSTWSVFPHNPKSVCVDWQRSHSYVLWDLSFPSESWWGLIHRDSSLEYERRNNRSKVSRIAFIQSFLDWNIFDCHFLPRLLCHCWRFETSYDYLPVSEELPAPFLLPSRRPNQSWTVRGSAVQVHGGGRTGEGLNLHLYMNVDACSGALIDMLRHWHTNHRATGCHLSSEVMGRGGRHSNTTTKHTHIHTQPHAHGNVHAAPTDNCPH